MSQLEQARLAWVSAQAALQVELAELEKRGANSASVVEIEDIRALIARRQAKSDEMLNRYITQLGKANN